MNITLIKKIFFNKKSKNSKQNEKKYLIYVTNFDKDGGTGTSLYNWWSDKWYFSHDETLKIKKKLEKKYDQINIVEYDVMSFKKE